MEKSVKEKLKQAVHEEKAERDYSIWNYFKEHVAVLVTTITSLIAFCVFLLRTTEYIKLKRYLVIWGIDLSLIDISVPTNYYFALATFVSAGSVMIASVVLYKKGEKLLPFFVLRRIEKQIRKKFNTIKKSSRENKEKSIDDEIESLMLQSMNTLEVKLNKNTIQAYLKTACIVGIPLLIVRSIMDIVYSFKFDWTFFIVAIVADIITVVLPAATIIKKTNEVIRKAGVDKTEIYEKSSEILQDHSFLERCESVCKEKSERKALDNSSIFRVTVMVAALFFITFMSAVFYSPVIPKQLPITFYQENPCVIIYNVENTYYLEEIEENDNVLTVFSDKQKIIKTDDMEYEMKYFEKVTIE